MSHTEATLRLPLLLIFSLCLLGTRAFSPLLASSLRQQRHFHELHLSSPASSTEEYVKLDGKNPSEEWEIDCYSRPVLVNGKKLWEVLITDSTGSFRYLKTLPSNQVNSRELRKVVEQVMEERADEYGVKPTTIRFFRGAMFNMINIALSELEVVARPSRCTFSLAQWLEERHSQVYPAMEGYKSSMATAGGPSFMDIRTPIKLPDALRGEKYAFVSLPLAEFLPGGSIDETNIGVGRLCPINPEEFPADAFVQGIVILTTRAKALSSWLAGTEVVGLSADLRRRTLLMETDIDTQYLMAKLNDEQRKEAAVFEEGKDVLKGLHFISVQRDEEDDPAGFWLLREIPQGI
jgi:hypothetical protein